MNCIVIDEEDENDDDDDDGDEDEDEDEEDEDGRRWLMMKWDPGKDSFYLLSSLSSR